MSFRRHKNRHDAWSAYCLKHAGRLSAIGLDPKVYRSEQAFREYVTSGTVSGEREGLKNVRELGDEQFWLLHEFITAYFDMDAMLFEDYESSRVSR